MRTPIRGTLDFLSRFYARIRVDDVSSCWEWMGAKNNRGYGMFSRKLAHRTAKEIHETEQISDTLVACHKCDNPGCVNPDHVFIGTMKDNMRDMTLKGRSGAQKRTHCKQGHEFSPENTQYTKSGTRRCVQCRKEYAQRVKAADPDAWRAFHLAYYHANKDRIRLHAIPRKREYYAKNRERLKEQSRLYQQRKRAERKCTTSSERLAA